MKDEWFRAAVFSGTDMITDALMTYANSLNPIKKTLSVFLPKDDVLFITRTGHVRRSVVTLVFKRVRCRKANSK
jgi:hypothetical protein